MDNIFGEKIPEKVYKYGSWPDAYTKDVLLNNRLYLSYPNEFNDPFDSDLNIIRSIGTTLSWIRNILFTQQYIQKKNRKYWIVFFLWKTAPFIMNFLGKGIMHRVGKNKTLGSLSSKFNHVNSVVKNSIKVYCFSAVKDNILMWSQYADKHTGICLEFDTAVFKDKLFKVHYIDSFIEATYKNIVNTKEKFLIQKSNIWEYEQEHRIVYTLDAMNNIYCPIPEECITGVICGCQMKDEDFQSLIATLNTRKYPVKVYKAEKKENTFGLDVKYIGRYGSDI